MVWLIDVERSATEPLSRTYKEYDVSRIAQQNPILDNDIRTPGARLIYGEGTEVIQKENGISYSFDFTKSMFSRGNISEKIRFSKFDVKNQVIVDLFAGLGYWVLQESARDCLSFFSQIRFWNSF